MCIVHKNYDELFGLDNVFNAWRKFRRGKTGKNDVMDFEMHLEDNLFLLYEDLRKLKYKHSQYKHFQVFDNKKRDIYKAEVRDRVVHQIIYDHLLSVFNPDFISDSYASRINKGQYKAINVLRYFVKLTCENTKSCFILKCDVKKYFESIDQDILIILINKKVNCTKIRQIISEIILSYKFSERNKGIPLGNVTSQIFANIYLNTLDHYVKNELMCRFYVRYNDDFIIVSESEEKLREIRGKVIFFVNDNLKLIIPIKKTSLRRINWGVNFLGFSVLQNAVLLRSKTKCKIYANLSIQNIHSYFGILQHCNSYNLRQKFLSRLFTK